MENIFVKYPKKGDIVVGELATGKVRFIELESYDNTKLSTVAYERIGVVGRRTGNEVLIIYKENESNEYCNRAWWYLTGYTLDGNSHTGTLSLRFASNSWASNIDKVITYSVTNIQDLATTLNAFFASDSDCIAQDWYADVKNDQVRIHCNNIDYFQCTFNTAKDGFTLSRSLPEISYLAKIQRINGYIGGEGAVSNIDKAAANFRNDQPAGNYNPSTPLTNIKRNYPVCLPAYLGTSANVQGDMCAILRAKYGEGESGWMKFLEAQRPVVPVEYGNLGMRNGLERTKVLASMKFTSNAVSTETACCKAANYCYQKSTTCIPQGNWYMPTVEDVYHILDGVKYATTNNRNADPVNKGLYKIGGNAISNGSFLWSCVRGHTSSAWHATGGSGFFNYGYMGSRCICVPVSLIKIA